MLCSICSRLEGLLPNPFSSWILKPEAFVVQVTCRLAAREEIAIAGILWSLSIREPILTRDGSMTVPCRPRLTIELALSLRYPRDREVRLREERRSYLPAPLFLEDAFWINLPVAIDSRSMGIDAAVGNASLHAVDNNSRFLGRSTTAPSAATEILAIPEYWEKHLFSILDLSRFQYAGG